MAKFQKIKEFFSDYSESKDNLADKLSNNFLRNIAVSASLLILYIAIYGLFVDLFLSFISLFYFSLFCIFLLLIKKKRLSDTNLRIITFIIITLFIFSLYLKQTDKVKLIFFFFIAIFSYMLFEKRKMLIFNFSAIIIFDILYFIFKIFHQFGSQEIIQLNIIFILLNSIFFFYKEIEMQRLLSHKNQIYTEELKIEQEKKIIAFALHQLRSTVNNYTVFEETEKKAISSKEDNEIEKIKQQLLESLCASFSLLENLSGKEEKFIANCSLDNVIDKIFSFYKINNRNIKIINMNQHAILPKNTEHQIVILKSMFTAFEIISLIIGTHKTNINFEFAEDDLFFSYKFFFKTKSEKESKYVQKLNILLNILYQILNSTGSNLIFSNKNASQTSLQLNFNKKFFFKNITQKDIEKKEIIDDSFYKLLLGEDDKINQKIYSIGFEKYFGQIDIADNGSEILKKLEKSKYNLLVMDLQMPTMNGIETIEKIRKIEELTGEHLLVIAITANTLIYNKTDILNFGFDDYFIKPFKIKDIYQTFLNLKK